jgi:hypothetical protein
VKSSLVLLPSVAVLFDFLTRGQVLVNAGAFNNSDLVVELPGAYWATKILSLGVNQVFVSADGEATKAILVDVSEVDAGEITGYIAGTTLHEWEEPFYTPSDAWPDRMACC